MNAVTQASNEGLSTAKLLINGEFVESKTTEWRDIVNPATQEVLARVPFATAEEVDEAIRSAHAAFKTWKNTPIGARMRIMLKFQALIREHSPRIAKTLSAEQGKTIPDAEGDIFRGLEVVEHACSIGTLQQGEFAENVAGGVDTYTLRQPIGVCAGITPFNFPAMIPLWMFPMAIVCGNTFVLKPSEQDPLSTMQLVELALEAGVPKGVLNVVHGGKDVVDALCTHRSGEGDFVRRLDGGGHARLSPRQRTRQARAIDDGRKESRGGAARCESRADLECARWCRVRRSGTALHGDLGDRAGRRGAAMAARSGREGEDAEGQRGQRAENGRRPGRLTRREAAHSRPDRNGRERGRNAGARRPRREGPGYEQGNFIGPTVFTDVTTEMEIYRQEIFGPVLVVLNAATLDDAIALVNSNPFGNGVGLFTQSGAAARKFQSEIDIGQVGINIPIPVPVPFFSFTGSRGSKLGDLGPYGKQVVQFYTQTKTVTARWFDDDTVNDGVNTTISLR